MKILHVIFNLTTGGAETMLIDILNHQYSQASVSLLIINDVVDINLLNTIDKRVNIYLINRKERNKLQLLTTFVKVNRLLNKQKPDIIHCHDNKLLPLFIKNKSKTVLTIHNIGLSIAFLKYYRFIFAISGAVQEDVKRRANLNSTVVLNGIETVKFSKRKEYSYEPAIVPFRIVLLSRLFPLQKGHHIAIKALVLLKEIISDCNIELSFIGTGDALNDLQSLAKRYRIDDCVIFEGLKNRQWVKKQLKDYHLLIQPSLYEGFGLTVVEGFAAGLPVIASNIDGPREIITTLQAGLTAEPGNPQDLADKIKMVYDSYCAGNIERTNYIIHDSTKLQLFDVTTTANNYLKEYSHLLTAQ